MPINEDIIDEIIKLVNEDDWENAFNKAEILNVEELERLLEKFDNESFNVEIVKDFLPEERREKYIDTFSRDSNKLEIIVSLSDDEVKAKYIEQFESASDKAKIILSFSEKDKLEYTEYLKAAIVEFSPDSKAILSILRDSDIEEMLEEQIELLKKEGKDIIDGILFDIIKDIPNDRKIKFLKYITDEELLLRLLLDMPATDIQSKDKYVELIIDYINREPDKKKVISAIKLLPKSRLTPEYIEILEQSIKNGRPDESTIIFLINSKPEKERIEYVKNLLIKNGLSENIQKSIGWEIFEKVCTELKDDDIIFNNLCLEFKEKMIDSMEWSERKIERIKLIGSDDIIKKYIDEFISNQNGEIHQLRENYIEEHGKILSIDEEILFKLVETAKIEMIGSLSDDKQKDYLDIITTVLEKFDNKEKSMLLSKLSSEIIVELINTIDNEENKLGLIRCMSEEQRANYIIANANDLSEENKVQLIKEIRNLDLLKKIIIDENILLPESIYEMRISPISTSYGGFSKEFIEKNLQWIIDKEMSIHGQSNLDDIKRREELVRIIAKENEDVWKRIDFRILDEKYVELLGLDKIKVISAFIDEQKRILALSDKKLTLWVRCINEHLKDTESSEWNIIGMDLLEKLESEQYDELIENIEDISSLDESEINLLTKLLQTNNVFDIRSIEDLRNFDRIKEDRCNELIASDDIEEKRLAVLEKIFGQDIETTESFLSQFKNIEELEESGVKAYLKALKMIFDVNNPTELEEIYRGCQSVDIIDKQIVTRAIKSEYAKIFNKDLFNPEMATKVEGEENVYEAGTDFRMIVCVQVTNTANQMSHTLKDFNKGAKQEWNMPNVTSQYMATSYIRNDNIALFGGSYIEDNGAFVYGFSEMEPSSLLRMYYTDAGTHSNSISAKDEGSGLQFLCPNGLIDETSRWANEPTRCHYYNEVNYSRQQNGGKKQPDYIVVFKKDGEIPGMNIAKRAQADWEGKLPIVIVDINKCLAEQKRQVDEMRMKYNQTHSPVLAREIYYKIRNNLNTIISNGIIEHFFDKNDLLEFEVTDEEISKYLKEHPEEAPIKKGTVSEGELVSIYGDVSAKERQSMGSKLRQMYQRIRYIRKHGVDKARQTQEDMEK